MKYSLQNKRGYYHAVVSYKDNTGKNRQKSITTKIKVQKGNKRRAEKAADDLVAAWKSQMEQDSQERKDPPFFRAIDNHKLFGNCRADFSSLNDHSFGRIIGSAARCADVSTSFPDPGAVHLDRTRFRLNTDRNSSSLRNLSCLFCAFGL